MAENYKELLILNNSKDAELTLYIYSKHDPFCWLSFESKIIPPNTKHLHRSSKRFQFKLVARFKDNRPKTILLETQKWVEDKAFEVTESLDCIPRKLADYPQERQICLRNSQRDKELKTTSGRRNLYDILGLNMKEVRKMKKEDQRKEIEKGFRKQMRIWHPDKHSGDDEIAKEILVARELLLDEEKRARYNNEADYDEGWFSRARYKAIFRPECVTEEQKKAYRKRMKMLLASALTAAIGIALTVGTAGLAAPGLVAAGAVIGSACVGAGFQSLPHTINKKAVVDKCDVKGWLLKGGIGLVCGAATGGIGVGMTAGMVGLGEKALSSAAVSTGQYIGIGAGTGSAGGFLSSVASDAAKKFVDGEEVSLKQAVGHALCGAAIGAAAGVAVGAVSKGFAGKNTSAASSNIEGDIVEQIARAEIRKGGRSLGYAIAEVVSRKAAVCGTEHVMGTTFQIVEERLDDSVENQSPFEHLKTPQDNLGSRLIGAVAELGGALYSHRSNEHKVRKDVPKPAKNRQEFRRKIRQIEYIKNREHLVKLSKTNVSGSYEPTEANEPIMSGDEEYDASGDELHNELNNVSGSYQPILADQPIMSSDEECVASGDKLEQDEIENGKVKYISEGAWISKMIVNYTVNGVKIKQEVSGSGTFVDIPSRATQIEVSFQVRRPFWGDVMKYDRSKRSWCKPYEPHVFRYTTPVIRTFTISGNLWWEAVMNVTDEHHL